jgi:hypothetical protein
MFDEKTATDAEIVDGAEDRLQGVGALASGEAWAVGVSRNAGSQRTLALRRLP